MSSEQKFKIKMRFRQQRNVISAQKYQNVKLIAKKMYIYY